MIQPRADRPTAITLGADKAYDAEDFVNDLHSMNVTPHVAENICGRSSAIDGRTTRHGSYAASLASASGSKRHSAGSRGSPGKRRRASVGVIVSHGPLPSLPRLQSGAAAQVDRGDRLMARLLGFTKAFIGLWRIVEINN